ncbi:DAK2 domain fusion protein YloV [Weissella beninensis]|uniref:DAK2 domain-containing protein n=1 Tax=Periweissella beninensis TaxID=504936 RepID=A0ABT0VFA0_9LACO|nr:DAK2 domain-containing protein [Periweissella beninensis]MBM7543472.1 DAK2 domain fusion protein YloV [Periweissella beninensis]MCM2436455.1 DAK2 domain-containing protein [Periweissella beninensis]
MEVVTKITNVEFGSMVNAAAHKLTENAEKINKLNVFPVPDGDTGTNMSLSMNSGAQYERDSLDTSIGSLAQATAKGLLMGARGNSGVILSQIFRGFAKSVENKDTLSARDLADALMGGAETAYKAVMKPTEGTILTVIREAASAANKSANKTYDVIAVMDKTVIAAQKALASTPDLLPVLKEVGVVDSGGQGLVFVLQAFYEALSGKIAESDMHIPDNAELEEMVQNLHAGAQAQLDPTDIQYGYCTEVMVQIGKGTTFSKQFNYDEFYDYLAKLGDSLLVINDDEIVKVHVHTENPGAVISWGTEYGSLVKVKVDNMRDQQQAVIDAQRSEDAQTNDTKEVPETAVLAVTAGAGIAKLYLASGATAIIDGGQTNNPSTADIVAAIEKSGAKEAIILPNNGNIFMAATQAAEIAQIPVAVVHTKTIQQGITALFAFNPDNDLTTNVTAMEENKSLVVSGQVTTAVRDTTIDGLEIHQGDYIGIIDGKLKIAAADLQAASIQVLEKMLNEDSEIVTILYGETANELDAQTLADAISEIDADLEIEIHQGGQPVYPFLISVE